MTLSEDEEHSGSANGAGASRCCHAEEGYPQEAADTQLCYCMYRSTGQLPLFPPPPYIPAQRYRQVPTCSVVLCILYFFLCPSFCLAAFGPSIPS
uniref:Uncharacterized protein n=1 Tax=Chromera velia CCMP2878 TaxID=1169474 RepID=A0A0G4HJ21_9ALVE|eukprot:Cvel_27995.t1-p1 / transcript=Cvel_27995.t1 / gene=Cvel_27995 / organism=Chromera_velia_CCMP2878 / gene_product=hypothetical protein / transcript_product=hypothetical protein / location=Cvel_scaffold3587:6721-7978(+) / protein_length=94 / sequence_SO=supercontig / SO=protein_coding / is_pseudo=false